MIERGDFDNAFYKAVDKMQGKKNKKPRHVKAAEEAFARANIRDIDRMQTLSERTDQLALNEMLRLAQNIERRQKAISPMLPLTDRKGYRAHFEFFDPTDYAVSAADNLFELHVQEAQELLERGRRGDKQAARKANELYRKAERLRPGTNEVRLGIDDSYYYGTSRIYMFVNNQSNKVLPMRLERALTTINFSEFRNPWQEFSTQRRDDEDFHMEIEITHIDLSPERIVERIYLLEKEIEVEDKKSESDTAVVTKTVNAEITERVLERKSKINANIIIRDLHNRRIVHHEPVFSEYKFERIVNSYRGDRRALPNRFPIGGSVAFPSEEDMIYNAGEILKDRIIDYVRGFDL
ncbi:MAG: hypothetical protein EA362_03305 [Saprospirales bacterium]|nr:MAG: hypothetical protein EA362_03305 [Saprospirales bacterium]